MWLVATLVKPPVTFQEPIMSVQLIIFGSPSCRITQMMLPIVQQVRQETNAEGRNIQYRYVDASQTPVLNGKWGVSQTPTFFIIGEDTGEYRIYGRLQGPLTASGLKTALVALSGPWLGQPIPR